MATCFGPTLYAICQPCHVHPREQNQYRIGIVRRIPAKCVGRLELAPARYMNQTLRTCFRPAAYYSNLTHPGPVAFLGIPKDRDICGMFCYWLVHVQERSHAQLSFDIPSVVTQSATLYHVPCVCLEDTAASDSSFAAVTFLPPP